MFALWNNSCNILLICLFCDSFVQPVQLDGYEFGTRSVAVLMVPRDGSPAELREQYLTNNGGWAEERHRFHMKRADKQPKID